ncbi:hypothetical protein H5P28_18860 [Ruficoccus amylovorans]|uniref:Lipoprotein n=1 Tax=Ruficoccus amylovorans TaxID=1804625 RepID=A0A842HIJ2_9BACT|nr:hypothetical protein [Ruficoccus amylovorans]MBC2596333.1 hypothetical protein [Ruficoccus amylovorans]
MIRTALCALLFVSTLALCHGSGNFPSRLGEWRLGGVTVYDDPALGFSLRYDLPQSEDKMDIYFYDNGQKDLGTGLSEPVMKELATVFRMIKVMEERGYYSDLSEPQLGQGTIDLGGQSVPFLFGSLSYRQTDKGQEQHEGTNTALRQSFALITAYHGRYLKVRFTAVGEDEEAARQQFTAAMEALENVFGTRQPEKILQPAGGKN